MKKLQNDQGFSLIELLMVAVILGLVMTAVYSLYLNSQKNAYQSEEIVDAQQNLRIAMDTMITDIRMSGFLTSSALNAVTSAPTSLAGGATFTLSAPVSSGIYSRSVGDVSVNNGSTGVVEVDSLMGASFVEADPVTTLIIDPVTLNQRGELIVTSVDGDDDEKLNVKNESGASITVSNRDLLLRRAPDDDSYPVSIAYTLVDDPDSDDAGLMLLQRSVNGNTAATVAASITSVELAYLNGDGEDSSAALDEITAVSLTITSKTEDNKIAGDKSRQLRTIVKIRNIAGV